ncbi:MAG: hypothetical protein KC983_01640 [Phycisphaerales bacterium]|nr:hypothetical protein [Phycisphaerales bacterium]
MARQIMFGAAIVALAAIATLTRTARADIQENDVILLYYGADPESSDIKDAYLLAHPGVHAIDVGTESLIYDGEQFVFRFRYTNQIGDPPPPNPLPGEFATNTPGLHANRHYITPEAFNVWIRRPLAAWISNYEESSGNRILAMATTRGLPAAISIDFNVTDCVSHKPRRIKGSFESALSAVRFGDPVWATATDCNLATSNEFPPGTPNDYYLQVGTDVSAWADSNGLCTPPVFVSRLDSEYPDLDHDGFPDVPGGGPPFNYQTILTGSHAAAVSDLITRSQSLIVNKRATTIVWDAPPSVTPGDLTCQPQPGTFAPDMAEVFMYLADHGWCVYADNTEAFLDGIYAKAPGASECLNIGGALPDSVWDPGVEGLYSGTRDETGVTSTIPELVHFGRGYNHAFACGNGLVGELADSLYTYEFDVHPAGLGITDESYYGISLHMRSWPWTPFGMTATPECDRQGQALHWIGAGGSFALTWVIGSSPPFGHELMLINLYEENLTWAEAVYAVMPRLASIYTPIGDPLAKVTVVDPDIDGDGFITNDDLMMASPEMVPHVQDALDADLPCDTFPKPGGPVWTPTTGGTATVTCDRRGDLSSGDAFGVGDGWVSFADLSLVIDRLATCGPVQNDGDANFDGVTDLSDLTYILRHYNAVLADVVGDDCLTNFDDQLHMLNNYMPGMNNCPDPPAECPEDIARLDNGVIVYCPDGVWDETDNTAIVRARLAVVSLGGGVGCENIGNTNLACGSPIHDALRRLFTDEQIDCNRNNIFDLIEIEDGLVMDLDGDGVIDDCQPCQPQDCAPLNPDGSYGNDLYNIDDLLAVINSFGVEGPCDIEPDNGDGTYGNGVVNIDDLLGVINRFGPCSLCND